MRYPDKLPRQILVPIVYLSSPIKAFKSPLCFATSTWAPISQNKGTAYKCNVERSYEKDVSNPSVFISINDVFYFYFYFEPGVYHPNVGFSYT